MRFNAIRVRRFGLVAAAVVLLVAVAQAELADVYLEDSRRLRGDVTKTDTEVIIKTAGGELRFPLSEVDRIVPVITASQPAPREIVTREAVRDEYMRRFKTIAADDIDAHFALAEWARDRAAYDLVAKQCRYILGQKPDHRNAKLLLKIAEEHLADGGGDPSEGEGGAEPKTLAHVPLLAEADMQRLKLYEYSRDGEAENVRVKFKKKPGQKDLPDTVLEEMANEINATSRRRLERGKPPEQLQEILALTDMKHADRIEIAGDTEVYDTFRKRIMPLIMSGCVKSGCHAGEAAAVFRLPGASVNREQAAYTSFVILDRLKTRYGTLVNRDDPTSSILLDYMLPAAESPHPHPPVAHAKFPGVLHDKKDKNFELIIDWLKTLRTPHPTYQLEYKFPDWLPNAPATPESRPAESPTSMPAEITPKPGDAKPAEGK